MACRKVFWDDPYLGQLKTCITSVQNNTVTLRETIIYAFSGGQASDSATINGHPVLAAEKEGNEIRYTIPEGHGLASGDVVRTEIDWIKRYRIMKLHFAAELVLELVYQHYNHPEKVGANITEDKARVDFAWEGSISVIFPELHKAFAALIDADMEITSGFTDEDKEIRYWEIPMFAKVLCGGTHIKRTGEIGKVKFKRRNIGSGRERIEIELLE